MNKFIYTYSALYSLTFVHTIKFKSDDDKKSVELNGAIALCSPNESKEHLDLI